MGAATVETMGWGERLGWRAKAALFGSRALAKAVGRGDFFGVHALLAHGADPAAWMAKAGGSGALASAPGSMFEMLLRAGCWAPGVFEARLRWRAEAAGSRVAPWRGGPHRGLEALDDAALMLSLGRRWEGAGGQALMASVGLGQGVREVLREAGARLSAGDGEALSKLATRQSLAWRDDLSALGAMLEGEEIGADVSARGLAPKARSRSL